MTVVVQALLAHFAVDYDRAVREDPASGFDHEAWFRVEWLADGPEVDLIVATERPVRGLGAYLSGIAGDLAEAVGSAVVFRTRAMLQSELEPDWLRTDRWEPVTVPRFNADRSFGRGAEESGG